ncbi:MAG TPA: helix-turn-helix domain-containing protein [Sphingobacteriaceae bacterium]
MEHERLNRVAPHKHTYFEIIWIEEGSGIHLIDFNSYPFTGPCLFLLQPSNVHQIFKDGPTKGNVIKFTESFFGASGSDNFLLKFDVFDNIQVSPVLSITAEFLPRLTAVLEPMIAHFKNPVDVSRSILESYLRIFLLEVFQLKQLSGSVATASDPRYLLFRNFKHELEKHYRSEHSVQFYAGKLNMTPRALNELSVLYSEKTPRVLVRERILLEAKRLLSNTRMNVKEICFSLGFQDPAYFTRFFTKNAGVSPLQFRTDPQKLF